MQNWGKGWREEIVREFGINIYTLFKIDNWDFPGGTEDKNLSANAGDTGLIPGLGRFYMLWNN